MVYVNNVFKSRGFLDIAIRNDPKTLPIPTAAPIRDIVAKPDAIIFAEFINIRLLVFFNITLICVVLYSYYVYSFFINIS